MRLPAPGGTALHAVGHASPNGRHRLDIIVVPMLLAAAKQLRAHLASAIVDSGKEKAG
jgi:hypothetical protein